MGHYPFSHALEEIGALHHEDVARPLITDPRFIEVHRLGVFLFFDFELTRAIETFAARSALSYLLLADITGEVSAMYGLWDRVSTSTVPG